MAANDLTTLADVKSWLAISDSTLDALLTRLITACSTFMQAYMNRDIISQAYAKTFNGDGKCEKMLENYPITAVASVTVGGTSIPAGTVSGGAQSAGYYFDNDTIYLVGYSFAWGRQNCSVSYTAGLASNDKTMTALAQACIEVVSTRFKERGRIGEQSKSVNGEVISFNIRDFPDDVRTLMDNLKNVVPAY